MKRWMSGGLVVWLGLVACGALRAQEAAATPTPAGQVEVPVVLATDTARLRELVGYKVAVEGKISRVGTTQDGKITFLNFSAERGGFVVVVFERSYAAFPEGLTVYANKRVRVTGIVQLFKEAPQINLERPDDIRVVEEAAPKPEATATPGAGQ